MFTYTPLLGARSSSRAVQSLLEFDGGIKILIDVGWDVDFDAEDLKALERLVPTISLVLLTHATVSHVGAYAHCCKHIPQFNQLPVYATAPVVALSQTLLQDLYASTPLAASFIPQSAISETFYAYGTTTNAADILLPPPTSEEIGAYLARVNQLKYLQPHEPSASPFSPPIDGLVITAYCAGHSLGGTIWHIHFGSESVVYAVDWHQARDNVFPGAAWLSGNSGADVVEPLRQPTALICSSRTNVLAASAGNRTQRDEQLIDTIRATVSRGNSVLIPCDSSARVLELAYVLDRAWSAGKDTLGGASLYLVGSAVVSTIRNARVLLEWMDDGVLRDAETTTTSQNQQGRQPFDLHNIQFIERKSRLDRVRGSLGPKVFLAVDETLGWGFSKQLFMDFASNTENLLLLVGSAYEGRTKSVSSRLWDLWHQHAKAESMKDLIQLNGHSIHVPESNVSPLGGIELAVYQQYLSRQQQRHDTMQADQPGTAGTATADAIDDAASVSSSSSEESDSEQQGKALNISAAMTHTKSNKIGLTDEELGINILLRRKGVYDFDVRGKKGRDRMFPFVARRRRNDDFGDLIRPEDFLRAEERDQGDGQDLPGKSSVGVSTLGEKRKWGDDFDSDKRRGHGLQGRRQIDPRRLGGKTEALANGHLEGAAVDESDESDYEPEDSANRGPLKATTVNVEIKMRMKLAALDFSGLHDLRSLQMLIPLIKPRKLILTAGTEKETLHLAEICASLLAVPQADEMDKPSSMVLTPAIGQSVDASVDTNAWAVKLSQALYRKLKWQTFRGLGIVSVNGVLELQSAEPVDDDAARIDSSKRQKLEDPESIAAHEIPGSKPSRPVPVLGDLPLNVASSNSTNQSLHVGDLRLAELRRVLLTNGHTAEFKGEGTLLIDDLVVVRKSGVGKIEVESAGLALRGSIATSLGETFHRVRRRIYDALAVVAGR